MRRRLRIVGGFAALFLMAATPVTWGQGPVNFNSAVDRISIADFRKLHAANGALVVDVRDPQSYQMGHIPGSVLIPLGDLANKAAELKKEKRPIVTYCA